MNLWKRSIKEAWKLRKREQSFLCVTHHTDLLYISIKLHKISLAVSEL